MRWNVSNAKQRFSEVVRLVRDEPQLIFNRDRLVAAVVDPEAWQAFQTWQARQRQVSLAEAFDELRGIAAEENYEFLSCHR